MMSSSIFTGIVLLVITGLLLLNAESVYNVILASFKGMFFWKKAVRIDGLPSSARERDIVSAIMALPASQVISTFFLSQSHATSGWNEAALYFTALGILTAYWLLRLGTRLTMSSWEISKHKWGLASIRLSANFFVIASFLSSLTALVCLLCGVSLELVGKIILNEVLVIYILMLNCKIQVLRHNCGFFGTFLYLCALEILPLVPIVISIIFFV